MGSKRTIITISEKDKSWLENYSMACGISMAEAIRRGITQLREHEEKNTYQKIVNNTRGIWKKGDGLKFQKKLRQDWR